MGACVPGVPGGVDGRMNDKCPKCGAVINKGSKYGDWKCGSSNRFVSGECKDRQIAKLTAERDELKEEQIELFKVGDEMLAAMISLQNQLTRKETR